MNTPNPDRTESGEAAVFYAAVLDVEGYETIRLYQAFNERADAEGAAARIPERLKASVIPVVPLSRAERAEAECGAMRESLAELAAEFDRRSDDAAIKADSARNGESCMLHTGQAEGLEFAAGAVRAALSTTAGAALLAFVERCRQIANGSATQACDVAWALAEYDKAINPQPQTREDGP